MDLVRDLLDIQVRDRRYRPCGRVDGVVLELHRGEAPRVSAIEMGATLLARRVHPRVQAWFERLASTLGLRTRPARVPIAHVQAMELQLTLDLDGVESGLLDGERRAAGRVRRRVPER